MESIEYLIKLSRQMLYQKSDPLQEDDRSYYLWINSPGGCVNEMFRYVDFLNYELKQRIPKAISVISGAACSAASYIAAAFDERYITKRSAIMIHELITGFWDYYTQFKAFTKHLDSLMEELIDHYSNVMINKGRDEIKQMLLENRWFTAQESLDLGLVTKILA